MHICNQNLRMPTLTAPIVPVSGAHSVTQLSYIPPLFFEMLEALRTNIARDLHDALGSQLAGLDMLLGHMEASSQENPALSQHLASARAQVHAAVATTRTIAHNLMPLGPEPDALRHALAHLAQQSTLAGQLDCQFTQSGDCHGLPQAMGSHLLRIAQEALHNATQHSSARSVRITLAYEKTAGSLCIEDNGTGFSIEKIALHSTDGLGLAGIRARAQSMGARISIDSSAQQGTCIRVLWQAQAPR
jgi:signal transduction histidine kinase